MTRDRPDRWIYLAIAGAGFILRIAWWALFEQAIENEGAEYARLADSLAAGDGYVGIFGGPHVFFPPLYPLLIAALQFIAPDSEFAARSVSVLAGTMLIPVTAFIAHKVQGRWAAILAALLVAFHPALVAVSASTYVESLYMILIMSGTALAIVAAERCSPLLSVACGATWALAYLARPEGLAAGVGFALLILVVGGWYTRRYWRAAACCAAAAMALVIISAPYIASLSQQAGAFRWEGKSGVNSSIAERMRTGMSYAEAARGLHSDGTRAGPMLELGDERWLLRARDGGLGNLTGGIVQDPVRRVVGFSRELLGASFLSAPAVALLAVFGFLAMRWRREQVPARLMLLGLGGFLFLVGISTEFRWARYFLPILPFGLVWAAVGIDRLREFAMPLLDRLAVLQPGRWAAALAICVCAGSVAMAYPATRSQPIFAQSGITYIRDAGMQLQELARYPREDREERTVIAGFRLALAYYSDATMVYLPYTDEQLALDYLERIDPDFVALDSEEIAQAPYLGAWLKHGIPHACAHEILDTGDGQRYRLRMWRWSCSREQG